jgi:hypothetical protein
MKTLPRVTALLVLGVCAALGAGCSKKTETKKDSASAKAEPAAEAQGNAATSPSSDPVQALPDDAIPTEEDFEPEIEQAIGPNSNLSAELDKIEKEISE